MTATYCNFTNLGTSSNFGVVCEADSTANTAVSFTNCVFTGSNCYIQLAPFAAWDGNFTFTGNSFSSSVGGTFAGEPCCLGINIAHGASSGTRTISGNAFDILVVTGAGGEKYQGNYFGGGHYQPGTPTLACPQYDTNLLANNTATAPITSQIASTSVTNCYFLDFSTSHPIGTYMGPIGAAGVCDSCIFDAPNNTGTGHAFQPPAYISTTAYKFIRNIGLPAVASGATPGCFAPCLIGGSMVITCEHNTFCVQSGQGGLLEVGNYGGSNPAAGRIASARANLCWASSVVLYNGVVISYNNGAAVTDEITVAGYNWHFNPWLGGFTCNGVFQSIYGYGDADTYSEKISSSGPLPNAQVGNHDINANPNFVDSTRNLGKWGQVVQAQSAGSDYGYAETIGWLISSTNLPNLKTNLTAMMQWVRAGFAPTNPAGTGSSYPGDSSATDANGNPWPLGIPGVGAMAMAGGLATLVSGSEHRGRGRGSLRRARTTGVRAESGGRMGHRRLHCRRHVPVQCSGPADLWRRGGG